MDVDEWPKTIEKKLLVVQCNSREKFLYAYHQLEGFAADWWGTYVSAHEEPDSTNCQEFRTSFRSYHVSRGTMQLKHQEFV